MILTVLAAASLALPAVAHAANPDVVRVDAASGKQTVLAGGDPWTSLSGLAVGASGVVYVASDNGVSALTPPDFAVKPFADAVPAALVFSGTTLYAIDTASVTGYDTTAPGTKQTVADIAQDGDDAPAFAALSGTTLYITTFSSCDSIEGDGGDVTTVNVTTGAKGTLDAGLDCDEPQGIAAAPDGSLLIAAVSEAHGYGYIEKVVPATGKRTILAQGGLLADPRGIALTASGDLIVADASSGVLRVTRAGKQTRIASGGALGGANAVALDAAGSIYVAAAGPLPVLKASATRTQSVGSGAVSVHLSCKPACPVDYSWQANPAAKGDPGESEDGSATRVGASKTIRIKLPGELKKRLEKGLSQHKTPTMTVTLTPKVDSTGAPGKPVSVSVRFKR